LTDGWPRFREAGDSAALLQWEPVIDAAINARAIAVADAARSKRIAGIRDVVSTFRSVAVYFDPLLVSIETVREALLSSAIISTGPSAGERVVEVPVTYGGDAGPDMPEVAAMTGTSESDVARRHADATYRVFMLGFLPGFAYMASVDERIAVPRRASPRVRVPAGSVGIAGRQTGVYPIESPGGWQIVGRTLSRVFDPSRPQPCLFAPGDSVRFVDVGRPKVDSAKTGRLEAEPATTGRLKAAPTSLQPEIGSATPPLVGSAIPPLVGSAIPPLVGSAFRRTMTVITPGLFTTVQDEGRWGHQGSGVSVSGAMDVVAHRLANAAVGNDRTAATLEVTLQGPELRVDHDAVVAVAGADLNATIDGAPIDLCAPTTCRSGSMIRFGSRRSGTRAYLAVNGGIDLPDVLGSRSTHAMTHLGGLAGRQLRAGDTLPIGESAHRHASRRMGLDRESRVVRLRAIPGPQDDVFSAAAFDILQRTRFTVSPQSNRMGYRLTGGPPIPRTEEREMISDATFAGALQVPLSGDPILLMADRQTTGGYPQIATVITADLPLAGQLAPGDSVEFELCSRSQAIAALVAQEAQLLALV
jgi:KipI family sensor histidine kinase inhibitor